MEDKKETNDQDQKKQHKWPWVLLGIIIGNFIRPVFDTTLQKLAEQFYEAKLQHPFAQVLGESEVKKDKPGCLDIICDDFSDLGEWQDINYFRKSTTTPISLKPPNSQNLTGWKSFYKLEKISPGFEAGLTFISKGLNPNTSFAYGDYFEVIVGDGVSNRISVKTPSGYVAPEGYLAKNFSFNYHIKPNTVIKLKVEVLPIKNTNKLSVKPTLNFYDENGSEQNVESPIFKVETQDNSESANDFVGFGIRDLQRTDKIEIVPISIVVRKLIF